MLVIEEILQTAKEAGASDVHLTVGIPPKMRVNGNLITMNYQKVMSSDTLDVLISIMSEAQRNIFEEQGEYDMSFSVPGCVRCRVSAYKQKGFVALAFRLLGMQIPSPEELELPEAVMNLCQKKKGLILVTGPDGGGKSAALAAMIDRINSNRNAHIITLEKPVEYLHQHKLSMVNQREIGSDTESYANALKAVLREDPDVILVGEMSDADTIQAVITAAETGHLVLSTLHTTGGATTVEYLINRFLPYQQQQIRMELANVLQAVVSKQLIPTVDKKGRAAAFEIMYTNTAVRSLIREGKFAQLSNVIKTNKKFGMITMDESICQLYQSGRIDRENAIAFAVNPDTMENQV